MTLFQEKIKEKILEINFYLVREIRQLVEIITVDYTSSNLYLLAGILREGEYGKIDSIEPAQNLFGEYIYVYRFADETDKLYYALIYDPTGLHEKLVVLEMFREVKSN